MRLQDVFISYLYVLQKYSDKSNVRKKEFILVYDFREIKPIMVMKR